MVRNNESTDRIKGPTNKEDKDDPADIGRRYNMWRLQQSLRYDMWRLQQSLRHALENEARQK